MGEFGRDHQRAGLASGLPRRAERAESGSGTRTRDDGNQSQRACATNGEGVVVLRKLFNEERIT